MKIIARLLALRLENLCHVQREPPSERITSEPVRTVPLDAQQLVHEGVGELAQRPRLPCRVAKLLAMRCTTVPVRE